MISPSFINGVPLTFSQTDDKLTLYRYFTCTTLRRNLSNEQKRTETKKESL